MATSQKRNCKSYKKKWHNVTSNKANQNDNLNSTESELPESTRSFTSLDSILADSAPNELKNLLSQHEDWLRGTTLKEFCCDVVEVTCREFVQEREKESPFSALIQKQLRKSKNMFIIRLHQNCQTPSFKNNDMSEMDKVTKVKSVSVMDYCPLTSNDKGFVFRRQLTTNLEDYTTKRILEVTGSAERSISNLKKMSPQEPLMEMTPETSIFDFDFNYNMVAVSSLAVQVENVGSPVDLDNYEAHYLDPKRPFTPLVGFPFINHKLAVGIATPFRYYSFPGSTTPMHCEDINLGSVNQNIGTHDKVWMAPYFDDAPLMWEKLGDYNNSNCDKTRHDDCVAHFRKKADFILATQLREWGVRFVIGIQQPGDIIVTPSQVPHQVTSAGYTANEAINIIDNIFLEEEEDGLPLCPKKKSCQDSHGHNFKSLTGDANFSVRLWFDYQWTPNRHNYLINHSFKKFDFTPCKEGCSDILDEQSKAETEPAILMDILTATEVFTETDIDKVAEIECLGRAEGLKETEAITCVSPTDSAAKSADVEKSEIEIDIVEKTEKETELGSLLKAEQEMVVENLAHSSQSFTNSIIEIGTGSVYSSGDIIVAQVQSRMKSRLGRPPNALSQKKRTDLIRPDIKPMCHICGAQLVNKYVLKAHIQIKHTDNAKKFKCRCDYTCHTKSDMMRHRKSNKSIKNGMCGDVKSENGDVVISTLS